MRLSGICEHTSAKLLMTNGARSRILSGQAFVPKMPTVSSTALAQGVAHRDNKAGSTKEGRRRIRVQETAVLRKNVSESKQNRSEPIVTARHRMLGTKPQRRNTHAKRQLASMLHGGGDVIFSSHQALAIYRNHRTGLAKKSVVKALVC